MRSYVWWQVDQAELLNQLENYYTLGMMKSSRKLSAALLALSATITLAVTFFAPETGSSYPDIIILISLAVFVYGGHKWATLAAMVYWTLAKGYAGYNHAPIIQFVWWALFMRPLFMAYKVGRNPKQRAPPPQVDDANKDFPKSA